MKKLFRKKEKGDIAIIAMFASILFVLILAIVVDFGLVYYQSAKLQNAVDATTVAVAHDLMSDDNAIQNTAEKYMRDNGIDLEKYGTGVTTSTDLKTVITYGDDKAKVTIDKKGLLTEETQQEDEDKYITSGYLKMTVYVKSNGLLSGLSGIKNLRLEKSGFSALRLPRLFPYSRRRAEVLCRTHPKTARRAPQAHPYRRRWWHCRPSRQ